MIAVSSGIEGVFQMNVGGLKTITKSVVGELTHRLGIGPFVCRGKVLILAYHRVVTPDDLSRGHIEPGMYVLRDVFDMHVRWLVEQFEILSFSQLLTRWNDNEWDDRKRYCVLTFDDGWLDNYRHAFPILKTYHVPATIFLPTNYVGSNEWFWPEKFAYLLARLSQNSLTSVQRTRAGGVIAELSGMAHHEFDGQHGVSLDTVWEVIGRCKLAPPSEIQSGIHKLSEILAISVPHERVTINWSEVAEMAKNGISFGSHSCSHHLLTRLDEETIRQELQESNRLLRALPAGYLPVFCYPNGDNNEAIQGLVKQAQYVAAVGTKPGVEGQHPGNMYELNRIGMHNDVSETIPMFSFHVFRSAWGL
ncbi:MAG: polysaccharide deacetylase family protein [Nitrospiraceae bacterium]|nr:polysaccharide deacetylase family protein [Nitrospiraceae bacterium]